MQADGGDGSIPTKGDQRGDHELTALPGQEPRRSERHWGHCQKTGRSQGPGGRERSGIWRLSSLVGGDQVQPMTGMAKAQRKRFWSLGSLDHKDWTIRMEASQKMPGEGVM